MWRVLKIEWLKMRKSSIWLLIFISPILSALIRAGGTSHINQWTASLIEMTTAHGLLFLPLLTGIFSAFICRYEHTGSGFKQLFSLPVSRKNVYMAKLFTVCILLASSQILFMVSLLVGGWIKGYGDTIPWHMIITSLISGCIACLPLAALQMLVSLAWASFAAPFALNVVLTLPNILIVNSKTFGPYYPWAQPFLTMIPKSHSIWELNQSTETLFIVITVSFLIFFFSGLTYAVNKEI